MLTADLIDSLTAEVRPVAHRNPAVLLAQAAAIGAALSLAVVAVVYGVQPGLLGAASGPFAMKAAYGLAVGTIALLASAALVRPDRRPRGWRALGLPAVALGLVAGWQLANTPGDQLGSALLGGSWDRCPRRIAILSVPILALVLTAVRRQAPTDLRRAGAAAGLLAGSLAAVVYAAACTEHSAAFVLVWYSLGISLSTAMGALVGPRALRW